MIDSVLYLHPRPAFWCRHPWVVGMVVGVIVLALPHTTFTVPVAIAALACAVFVGRRGRALWRRDAQLRARAEFEHRLSLAGDARGVFGRYPPVQAGWFPDPANPRLLRYFDGALWTGHSVVRQGVQTLGQ